MSKRRETWKLWRELHIGYDRGVVRALADPVAAGSLWFKARPILCVCLQNGFRPSDKRHSCAISESNIANNYM